MSNASVTVKSVIPISAEIISIPLSQVVYMELEKGQNVEYWRDMTVIVEDELRRLKQDEAAEGDAGRYASGNISNSVLKSVADTLKSKTYAQLAALEQQVFQHCFRIFNLLIFHLVTT